MSSAHDRCSPALRIGAVNYLNARPLVVGLAEALPAASITYDLPSRLADRLASGELDVALAPCVELPEHPEWSTVSSACIGARGPVLSVKLLFRVSPGEVQSLALDEGSRTSAALAQILLAERCGVRPRLEPLPIGASAAETSTDAVLIIGDRAIGPAPEEFSESWDLGAVWREWTGLPMVFAMWMARPGLDLAEIEPALDAARDCGVASLPALAESESQAMQLPYDLVYSYLSQNLHYEFGPNERRGLGEFFRRATALELIVPAEPWQINDPSPEHRTVT
ncbi:menaquinone biosynthesis protein [Pirellulales bacterium]|nr:menaquinone biosynthesis protein [Pirellulales bacterium]